MFYAPLNFLLSVAIRYHLQEILCFCSVMSFVNTEELCFGDIFTDHLSSYFNIILH